MIDGGSGHVRYNEQKYLRGIFESVLSLGTIVLVIIVALTISIKCKLPFSGKAMLISTLSILSNSKTLSYEKQLWTQQADAS